MIGWGRPDGRTDPTHVAPVPVPCLRMYLDPSSPRLYPDPNTHAPTSATASLSRSSSATPSLPLPLCGEDSVSAWWRGGLGVSKPWREGPVRQGRHEWLPSGSSSLSQSCERYLFVVSSLPRLIAAVARPLSPVNSACRQASILSSSMEMLRCAESACCKRVFQVLQMFQRYVASVSYVCCKNRSGCCNCFRWMLQAFVQNVSSISNVYLQAFWSSVAYVSRICCKNMFQMFQSYVAASVFMLQVVSIYLKVAYVAMAIYVCYKCIFQLFLEICYKCFIWTLYML
jgi:hypothetical protein